MVTVKGPTSKKGSIVSVKDRVHPVVSNTTILLCNVLSAEIIQFIKQLCVVADISIKTMPWDTKGKTRSSEMDGKSFQVLFRARTGLFFHCLRSWPSCF